MSSAVVVQCLHANNTSSKEIQFSIFSPQETVRLSEFQVTHRDLYTPGDRLPVKDGVLDRRLVRPILLKVLLTQLTYSCREQPKKTHAARPVVIIRRIVLDTMLTLN